MTERAPAEERTENQLQAARAELRRCEARLRGLTEQSADLSWLTLATEQSPASVIMTDTEGVITYVNPGFTAMTGYTAAEVIGQTPRVLKSGLTRAEDYDRLWATVRSGQVWRGEFCNRRKDGRLYWHSASVAPIHDAAGRVTHFLAVQQDISPRIEAEAALRQRDARLRSLMESNLLGIGFADAAGRLTEANDEFLRIAGYSREDLLAGAVTLGGMTPPDRTGVWDPHPQGGTVAPMEKELLRKGGRRVPVMAGAAPLGERENGSALFLVDLTERRALEGQLRQSQKMEAVGRLAGGVAHDFNNILTTIVCYSDLLRLDLPPADPSLEAVGEIRRAADRAAALTRQLLAFSRRQVLEPRRLDLGELVHNLENMLRRLLGEDVQLVTRLEPALGTVTADPNQLEQVIMNLAVNGRDAMPGGGALTIETRNAEIDAAYAADRPGLTAGRYVALAVSDAGCGMDQATRSRVFEPFFTTKDKGKGTGLGLSTVYGIVKQSEGFIDVVSEPGQGATFTVYLPRVEHPADTLPAPDARPMGWTGSGTILVAEDDEGVRKIVGATLARAGYTVLEGRDGADALGLGATHPGALDLLLTDLVMPGMSGRDLAARLLAERPRLPVLYMSGYSDDEVLRRGIVEDGSTYLKKPFNPESLLRKIREVLDTRRSA
jgi:PAS domain S-box-containing protein